MLTDILPYNGANHKVDSYFKHPHPLTKGKLNYIQFLIS